MPDSKHYVYSARTTEKGLALLNKARADRSWDAFISEAVTNHYGLPLDVIALPHSKPNRRLETRKHAAEPATQTAEPPAADVIPATTEATYEKKKKKGNKTTKKTTKEAKGNAEKTERHANPA